MKKGHWLFLTIAILSLSIISCDKEDEGADTRVNFNDSTFSILASMVNIGAVASSQIVADSSADSTIIDFAEMVLANHTAAQGQLQTIASQLGLATTNTLDAEYSGLIDSLKMLKGTPLDSVYVFSQIRLQSRALDLFKQHDARGLQRDLGFYSKDLLEVLTVQLREAATLSQKY